MNINFLVFLCLILFEQELSLINTSNNKEVIYLPMTKDHKYGDDICYYRELDEKKDYYVYYVKPCEKGQYCEDVDSSNYLQPFGFCKDIPTNATDLTYYGDPCNKNWECGSGLECIGQKCLKQCPNSYTSYLHNLNDFGCEGPNYHNIGSNECYKAEYHLVSATNPKRYGRNWSSSGVYPGLPNECGIYRYGAFGETKLDSTSSNYIDYQKYYLVSKEWCKIGGAKDGEFVDNSRFCKSGYTLKFYPNGDLDDPAGIFTPSDLKPMCVTPIAIDKNNPFYSGCVVTYKIGEGSEQKYRLNSCDENLVLESQLYSEFIEEFNNANEDDQKACYRLPQDIEGNCQNINLLKLYYFYKNSNDYLFYKDRKKLETVLHFKIQQKYQRYYEFSTNLNMNYLVFLLFLIFL